MSSQEESIDIFKFYDEINADDKNDVVQIESIINDVEDITDGCDCGGKMEISNNLITLSCNLCGKVSEYEEKTTTPSCSSNLLIRGPNNSKYQGELYGSSKIDTVKLKKKNIQDEYMSYYNDYVKETNLDFPKDVFVYATNMYNQIQAYGTKRSENKKIIMATCLYYACHLIDFSPSSIMIGKLMKLKKNSIESGINNVITMINDKKIFIDGINVINSEIITIFNKFKIDKKYFHLKKLITELIDLADSYFIGIKTQPHNKNIGAIYIILSKHPDLAPKISLDEVCKMKDIRITTIQQYINELNAYKSKFLHIYNQIDKIVLH